MLRKTESSSKANVSENRTVIRSFPDRARSAHKGFIEGAIMSHEIENPSNDLYMLLSLHAQATLGVVKHVAAGTVYLKRQDAYVQLYAVEGCDLRAVCISDFPDIMRSLPPTPIEQPCTVEEEGTTERQARRLKARKEFAEMND